MEGIPCIGNNAFKGNLVDFNRQSTIITTFGGSITSFDNGVPAEQII